MRIHNRSLIVAAGLAVSASVAHAQIANGGFETGAFAPAWTQFGNTGFTTVNALAAHSGAFGGRFGPTLPGGITQPVACNTGESVTVSFWFYAPGGNNTFTAALGGQNLVTIVNDTNPSFTFYTYTLNAPSTNPVLELTFLNPPDYSLIDDISVVVGTPFACCLQDGSCTLTNAAGCTLFGGVFHNNQTCGQVTCPPPATGACCSADGTSCQVVTQAACLTSGGVYAGDNITCAAANCRPAIFAETVEAGDLPGTATPVSGTGQPLVRISGAIDAGGDGDMFQFQVCDAAHFSATTAGGTTLDTILSLYTSDGTGVTWNDDEVGGPTLQSRITSQFVSAAGNGTYYIHVSQFNKIPYGNNGNIWINDGIAFPYRTERAPDGPGAPGPITGWNASTGTGLGSYAIAMTGSCFLGGGPAPCYANCDGSTSNPLLTANDFQCFLNFYAAANTIANCDASTGNPLLTANDFQCFLNKYAVGCT